MENLSLDGLHRLMNAISAREEYLRKVKEELERRLALGQPESATVETTAAVTMEAAETVTANNEGETERSEEETNEQEAADKTLFDITGLSDDDERLLKLLEGDPI